MANRRATVKFPVFNNYEVRVILSRDVRATCRRLQVDPDCLACFIPNGKRGHLVLPVDVDAGTIAHEASHVIQHLFSFVGARRDEETFAYHLDYLVGRIDRFSKRTK